MAEQAIFSGREGEYISIDEQLSTENKYRTSNNFINVCWAARRGVAGMKSDAMASEV